MTLGAIRIAHTRLAQSAGARSGESGRMRSEIPPPGRAMAFSEWAAAIVAGVRVFLPDAKAVRKGSRLVIMRHSGREAHLGNGGRTFWVTFTASDMKDHDGLARRRSPR